ncbi:MAG: hypothetical protein V2I46_00445 [Bacteroides sp.]|jgi:hypothetical protein|nr:hypothetical protein [Bacteroides sp.]
MKGMLKNIAVWLVLITFLVSASGFRLIRHTCPSCNIVEYTLDQPDVCCGERSQPANMEPVSCCTIPDDLSTCRTDFQTTSCCEYESTFFVVDELISSQTLKVASPLTVLPLLAALLSTTGENADQNLLPAFLHPPPPVFSGTDYLFFLHQLKIDFC